MKNLFFGIVIGGAIVAGIYSLININKQKEDVFANKERCVKYTEKRQTQSQEEARLSGHGVTVEGFYSPVANTCMTKSYVITSNNYTQLMLRDEFTGKVEASAVQNTGKSAADLPLEVRRDQIKQDKEFYERLKYFQGIK